MPKPASTHVDSILTRFSRQYPMNEGMLADTIAPGITVGKESGKYFRYDRGDQTRVPYTKRTLRSESRRVDWRVDTATYQTEEYALNDLIDDREYGIADTPLNLQQDTISNLTRLMQLDREKRVHSLATDTAVITKNTTLATTAQWRDAGASGTTSEPITDVETGSESIRSDTGLRPNVAFFGMAAWLAFQKNDQVVDRIITPGGNWGAPTVSEANAVSLLAPFGISSVMVSGTIENTGGFGAADSFADLWIDQVLLAYINPRPGLRSVTFMVTFWSRRWQVRRSRIDTQHSDWFEPSYVSDENVIAADVAYLILDVSDGT
jgi:hypothetical protein